jgi:hypothetical protein
MLSQTMPLERSRLPADPKPSTMVHGSRIARGTAARVSLDVVTHAECDVLLARSLVG